MIKVWRPSPCNHTNINIWIELAPEYFSTIIHRRAMLCGWLNLQCLLPLHRARSPDLKTVIQWSERVRTNAMSDMYHTYLNEWASNHNMKRKKSANATTALLAFTGPTSCSLLIYHNEKLWQPTTWIILIVWFGSNKLRHIHRHTYKHTASQNESLRPFNGCCFTMRNSFLEECI